MHPNQETYVQRIPPEGQDKNRQGNKGMARWHKVSPLNPARTRVPCGV